MSKLKLGLFGVGHLGKIHLKCIEETGLFELVGFYDPDNEISEQVSVQHKIKRFHDMDALISAVELVDIVTPTLSHYEIAKRCIAQNKHFFVEKPLTNSLAEAKELLALIKGKNIKAQVGHVERFNPAYLSIENKELQPLFIEAHRLSSFNSRGIDVSVVLDLMIHDLDIILKLVNSPVRNISAVGVSVLTQSDDISNARIEFENGCIANITASRMSLKQMRKLRLFQNDAYISMDFLNKKSEFIKITESNTGGQANFMEIETPAGLKYMSIEEAETVPVNAIKMELESLYYSIKEDKAVKVSLEEGYNALKLAHDILEKIDERNARMADIGQIINS